MKRHYVICCLLFLLSSCRPAGPGAEPLPTVVTTVTPTALTATATLPTSVPEVTRQTIALDPTASATPFTALPSPVPPTVTATAAGPLPTADLGDEARLFGLYFGPAEATLSQPVFPAGTTEVFAYWTYWNLTADDVLRREWRRNGQPWLEHEEPWDVTRYGSSGVRGDVSVYDFTAPGLQPGVYSLTLLLNGQFQARATFEIQAAGATGAPLARSGDRIAQVVDHHTIMVSSGGVEQLRYEHEDPVSELLWLPDGEHLFFVGNPTAGLGLAHYLWRLDVASGAAEQIRVFAVEMWRLALSPDGHYLRLITGSDFAYGCSLDRDLAFLQLDDEYNIVREIQLRELPSIWSGTGRFPYPTDAGQWLSPTVYEVNLTVPCLNLAAGSSPTDLAMMGLYQIDLITGTVSRRPTD
ncbi:MAG: hypothetical protein H6651_10050 [Ardenticatenales bacterium]|nr:hypothetical protein [Ardenticatenales bacterium]